MLSAVAAPGAALLSAGLGSAHDLWLVRARFVVAPGAKAATALITGHTFPAARPPAGGCSRSRPLPA